MPRRKAPRNANSPLTDDETRDICLWFGWGAILGYPTSPRDYLREALKPENKPLLLAMPRPKRRAILRFVIDEWKRRIMCPVPLPVKYAPSV